MDLIVHAGTVVVVTGPSGCGKTTLLKVIAGEEELTAGSIWMAGRAVADEVTDVEAKRRPVATVPQGGQLLPDRNAGANIALGLPPGLRRSRKGAHQVSQIFDLVGLPTAAADRRPDELSISERQRVALGRALVDRPTVLLLDEPFFAFDPATRARLRGDLHEVLQRTAIATVVASHDPSDVTDLADQHLLLADGRLSEAGRGRR